MICNLKLIALSLKINYNINEVYYIGFCYE